MLLVHIANKRAESEESTTETETPQQQATPSQQQRKHVNLGFDLFNGGSDDECDLLNSGDGINDEEILQICTAELSIFMHAPGIPLMTGEDEYSDPLEWWKKNQTSFKWLAELAKEYLCPPATSAPSERVWSRAARLITAKRSRLSSDVTSDIMFVHENLHVLYDKWEQIQKDVPLEEAYLPPLRKQSKLKNMDWEDFCGDT